MGTIIRYLLREIEKLIILSILYFGTIHKNYLVLKLHSVVCRYALPNIVNTMQESMHLIFKSLQLNRYMENAVFSFQVQNLFQIIFQLKGICCYFFCYRLPKKKNHCKKYPRLIIWMIQKLFITILWTWVLKLQFFTTVCKMCNIIFMQFIIETDICINLTFV